MAELRDLLNPLTPARLALRALDDLNAVAEVARREPHPVDELAGKLDATRDELVRVLHEIQALTSVTSQLIVGGAELESTTRHVDLTARELHDGGQDLLEVARALTANARELARVARVVEPHIPQALRALDAVEDLEDSVETVADTLEPLQGTAERVGRVAKRLSRN